MNHLFILLLIVSLFFTSCNKDSAGQSVPIGGNLPTNYIIISDGAFSPNSITVVNGSSITFVNHSGVAKGIYSSDSVVINKQNIADNASYFLKKIQSVPLFLEWQVSLLHQVPLILHPSFSFLFVNDKRC